uniref:Uncharacterized protein n=1 Tax=Mycena chlorophos TaxID=658473 RepID=A0ABQ0LWA0_MYCCL|nr:predicted protein [Mycena chlorophos]
MDCLYHHPQLAVHINIFAARKPTLVSPATPTITAASAPVYQWPEPALSALPSPPAGRTLRRTARRLEKVHVVRVLTSMVPLD